MIHDETQDSNSKLEDQAETTTDVKKRRKEKNKKILNVLNKERN